MSVGLLQSLDFAQQFKIAQANIDPVAANTDGVLLLANGHTDLATVPNMYYQFTVDASSNVLSLIGQRNAPVPAITVFSVDPLTGQMTFDASGSDLSGSAVSLYATAAAPAAVQMYCTDATNQEYRITATNTTGGGLTSAHLQVYSYNTDVPASPLLDISPPSLSNEAQIVLNGDVFGSSFSADGGMLVDASGGYRLNSVPSVTSATGTAVVGYERQGIAIFNTLASLAAGASGSVVIQSTVANLTWCQITCSFSGHTAGSIPVCTGYVVTSANPSLITIQYSNAGSAVATGASMEATVYYSFCQ